MLFREKLSKLKNEAVSIMNDKSVEISERYKKWDKMIYKAAMGSIGKSTKRTRSTAKPSSEIIDLRKERKILKKQFEE